MRGRSRSPIGKTPVVRVSTRRQCLSIISIVTNKVQMYKLIAPVVLPRASTATAGCPAMTASQGDLDEVKCQEAACRDRQLMAAMQSYP